MSHTTTQIDPARKPIGSLSHMRAGVYRGKGRVVVESVPVPEIGEGEMLFRVAACGICGTDIKKIEHGYVAPPQILGHELAGTVVKVGAGVKKFKAGDRVMSFHHVPCSASFERKKPRSARIQRPVTAGSIPTAELRRVRARDAWVVRRGMIALPPDVCGRRLSA
jgi:L-iditol 2-dehydrogenase